MYDILNLYLENGLRVIMHKIPHIRTMASGIWVRQGSKHEDDNNNGLSHLLEHLIINVDNKNNQRFQKLISELSYEGVVYNAGTTKENTFFHFSGLSKNLEKCIETLAEMVINNRDFPEELVENEKKVVTQEAIMFYSSFNQIKERTSQALYGNMGVGRTIVGSIDNIKNATNENLKKILEERYTPENCTLVVIGGINYEKALDFIVNNFSSWEDKDSKEYKDIVESEAGIFFNSINNGQNSVLSVGFRTGSFASKDRTNTEIISKIIGEAGLESRLVKEIRVKRGLAYTLGSFTSFYEKRGCLGLTVACAHESVNEVINVISNEINKIKVEGFTDEEVDRAKKILETRTLLDLDNILAQLKFLGKCTSYGHLFSLEQEIRSIKKVKKKDLNCIANELFVNDNMGLAAIGNFDIDKAVQLLKIS